VFLWGLIERNTCVFSGGGLASKKKKKEKNSSVSQNK
jgi:hypothetical protein